MSEASERSKYERMWEVDGYRVNSPAVRQSDAIVSHLQSVGAQSVLDAGCGSGRLSVILLEAGFSVQALDIAHNCLNPEPRERLGDNFSVGCLWKPHEYDVDAVVCVDVMEHIPTEHVDDVLDNLYEWAAHGYVNVALFHDGFGRRIGETLHLTVKPVEWWLPKLPATAKYKADKKELTFWW